MRYKVTMKSGKVYRASKVEIAMGFITMQLLTGELKLPSGEVIEVRKLNEGFGTNLWKIIAAVVWLMSLIIFYFLW